MKKTKLKKKSKSEIAKIQDKLWQLCRQIVFKRYGNRCYTCSKGNLGKQNLQCGHPIAKAALPAKLKYDIRFLRPQCFKCNINYGGMGGVFIRNLEEELPKESFRELVEFRKTELVKAKQHYLKLIEEYEEILKDSEQEVLTDEDVRKAVKVLKELEKKHVI